MPAIVAFSRTFLPRCGHSLGVTHVLPPRHANGAKKENLPIELLLVIFKLVYEQEMLSGPPTDLSDTLSPSLFPYAIASVCRLWRDAMSMVPEFWKRIVVPVDSPSESLPSAVLSQLSWSRDILLDLIVSRTDFECSVNSQREMTHVMLIVKAFINPHIRRLWRLRFDVMFSSSLPPFPGSFCSVSGSLRHLELGCRENRGRDTDMRHWDASMGPEYYHALTTLLIDGPNYYHARRRGGYWRLLCPNIRNLTVSHYGPLLDIGNRS
jgi:hypothetical protein